MARKIHCAECTKYLGEIRDAKLMKGMAHLCPRCSGQLINPISPADVIMRAIIGRKAATRH